MLTIFSSCDVTKITSMTQLIFRRTMVLTSRIEMWSCKLTKKKNQNEEHLKVISMFPYQVDKITCGHAAICSITKGMDMEAMKSRF